MAAVPCFAQVEGLSVLLATDPKSKLNLNHVYRTITWGHGWLYAVLVSLNMSSHDLRVIGAPCPPRNTHFLSSSVPRALLTFSTYF
jgi:hypothetical protein